ncbi:unnamed protein product [Orchesella dallaii]|uniref:BTB domain-containing protein n=1 Tax=Orchesella dallaii TaxID=48710 RepID=A0ABP1RUC1_9HEXA
MDTNLKVKSSRTQAYLIRSSLNYLKLDRQDENPRPFKLYVPIVGDFKGYPNAVYDDEVIKTISEIIKDADGANTSDFQEPRFLIEMSAKYNKFLDKFQIFAEVHISRTFCHDLTNIIVAPTISIAGSYHAFGFFNPDETTQNNGDMERQPFQVSGIPIKYGMTSHEFQGFEQMNEMHKSSNKQIAEIRLKFSVTLEWKEFSLNSQQEKPNVLDKLLFENLLMDCTIKASNGEEFPCHKNILATHSDVLHVMLSNGMRESQTSRIEMEDLSANGVRYLLSYMCGRELQPTEPIALELLQSGHKYNIVNLEEQMLKLLRSKPADWFTINGILELYFFSVNIEQHEVLCEKLLRIMKRKPNYIRKASLYQEMVENFPKVASELEMKLLDDGNDISWSKGGSKKDKVWDSNN